MLAMFYLLCMENVMISQIVCELAKEKKKHCVEGLLYYIVNYRGAHYVDTHGGLFSTGA